MYDLTVIVANTGPGAGLQSCVDSVVAACRGLAFELVVATTESGQSPESRDDRVRTVRCADGSLVPHLWASGIRAARGRIVALTIADMRVAPQWARRLVAALDAAGPDIAGVGGGFTLGRTRSMGTRGMFYLRYNAFLAPRNGAAAEIAGDNAAYRREALMAHADSFATGFWEVEFHRRLAGAGQGLRLVDDAPVVMEGQLPLLGAAAQRFQHGRHFARWRVGSGARERWKVALGAPLVPAVLALRIARRVMGARRGVGRFVLALPAILFLASAWALGELRGAVGAPGTLALSEAAA